MTAPLHDCVIRFWQEAGAGRKVAGTGFLATGVDGQTYALTCAHVANLALGRNLTEDSPPQHGASVTVDLMGRGGAITLDLLEWRPPAPLNLARATDVADIAVFAPRAPFAAPYRPPLRIEPPSRVAPPGERVAFHSFGFMGTQNGVSTQGALTAVDAGGWFVADGDEEFRRFIEEGLSGAPVFADGRVLGMVVQRLERDARQGLVIPAFALARAWPPLASPYPGLPAFDSDTAHLFFGRGRAVAPDAEPTGTLKELLDRLNAQRLVALMGASGSGKSSLAKAGVADVYRQRGWIVLTLRPGLEPLRNLAEAIASAVEGLKPSPERILAMDRWEKALEANRLTEALALARGQGASGVLIVVDQFEEFFPGREDRADAARTEVLATEMARQRAVILPQLRRAVERGEAHCLLTARLDLIEAMVSADEEAAKLFKDPYPIFVLTRMAAREAREAIEGPAALFGTRADAGFATDLAAAATQGEGRLPLLQETLRQCWAGLRRGPDGWRLQPPKAAETSDPARLLEESLARRGEQALAALRPDLKDPADLTDVQRVLLALVRLVAGQPARRLLPLAELPADDRALLDRLADERLVVIDGERCTAELVHEALMVRWPQLAAWIDGQRGFLEWRDRFERDFAAWREGGREAKDALRRHDLATAQDWADGAARERGRPTPEQADFIAASRAVHEAEDRRKADQLRQTQTLLQQTRRRLWVAVVALLLSGFAIWYALHQSGLAQHEAKRAEDQASLARQQSALALDQAKRAEGEAKRAEEQSRIAEQQANLAQEQSQLAQHEAKRAEDRTEAAQLQESRALAILAQRESASGDQGTAMLLALEALPEPGFGGKRPLSVEAGTALRQAWMRNREMALIGHRGAVVAASFSPDGRSVVTASEDKSARVWNISGVKPTATILEGHRSWVNSASFSLDGRRVVTASLDGTVRVWDLSGPLSTVTILNDSSLGVWDASFNPDGQRVLSIASGRTARVWELSGGEHVAINLEGHDAPLYAGSFSPDGRQVITESWIGTAYLWNLSESKPAATILQGKNQVAKVAPFSPDGRRIVTASSDGTARVWDISGARPTSTILAGHNGAVKTASFGPDGQRVVTASVDGTARVWELSAPELTSTILYGHKGEVNVASFSPDGRRVLTASSDGTARVWEISGANPTSTILAGHNGAVKTASFSPDGQRVVTASADGTARVWELSASELTTTILKKYNQTADVKSFSPYGRRILTGSRGNASIVFDLSKSTDNASVLSVDIESISHAQFSPDGSRVAIISNDGTSNDRTVNVWDLSKLKPNATALSGHHMGVESVVFGADGYSLITIERNGNFHLWDLSEENPTDTIIKGADPMDKIFFSPSDRHVVSISKETGIRLWDLTMVNKIYNKLENSSGNPIFRSPDGRFIISGSEEIGIKLWDLSEKNPRFTLLDKRGDILKMASFSPDNHYVLVVSKNDSIRIWNLSASNPIETILEGYDAKVDAAIFSRDARWVLATSKDGTNLLWDLSKSKPTASILPGTIGSLYATSFSPDSLRIAAPGVTDNTALVWDLSGGKPTATILEGHNKFLSGLSFIADGRQVITTSYDGTIRRWEVYPDINELITLVRSRLTRCLSSAQREQFGLPVADAARPRYLIPAPDASGLCPR